MGIRRMTIRAIAVFLLVPLTTCTRSGGESKPTRPRKPELRLRSPQDGSLWLEGAPALVSWKARGLRGADVLVELSSDLGVEWETAARVPQGNRDSRFAWVPAGGRRDTLVRVRSGDGSVVSEAQPVEVVPEVIEVVMGTILSFCLRADGTVRVWGWMPEKIYEVYGPFTPLPFPVDDDSGFWRIVKTPKVFPGLERIRSLAPMGPNCNQLLAVTEDDRVIQWGDYLRPLPPLVEPVEVPGLTDVLFCRAGGSISFARCRDGRVFGWGRNQAGTLGDGTDEMRPEPIHVPALDGVVDIAVGWIHCLALEPDGTVLSWGQNAYGTLGDGTAGLFYRTTPEPVPGIEDAVAVLASFHHSVALLDDGSVWTWGDNGWGQLGRETPGIFDPSPGLVLGLPRIVGIHGGGDEVYAFSESGDLYVWGSNGRGQLGVGNATGYLENALPTRAEAIPPLRRLFAGAGSAPHAITKDGTWIAWGANIAYSVGDGSGEDQWWPVPIVAR